MSWLWATIGLFLFFKSRQSEKKKHFLFFNWWKWASIFRSHTYLNSVSLPILLSLFWFDFSSHILLYVSHFIVILSGTDVMYSSYTLYLLLCAFLFLSSCHFWTTSGTRISLLINKVILLRCSNFHVMQICLPKLLHCTGLEYLTGFVCHHWIQPSPESLVLPLLSPPLLSVMLFV